MNSRLSLPEPTPQQLQLGRRLRIVVIIATIAVWGLVGLMRRPEKIPLPEGVTLDFLPPVHAAINTAVALLLILAWVLIRRGNLVGHRRAMLSALAGSALFLVCYVAYHFTTEETRFGGEGIWRGVYLGLLISHIVCAAVSFPLILQTWAFAWTGQYARHRSWARWTFPLWLYVAVTGPICYLMLRPYYGG